MSQGFLRYTGSNCVHVHVRVHIHIRVQIYIHIHIRVHINIRVHSSLQCDTFDQYNHMLFKSTMAWPRLEILICLKFFNRMDFVRLSTSLI